MPRGTQPGRPEKRPLETIPAELRLVVFCVLVASVLAFTFCYGHGLLLLYGDAVAHLGIARRVFDSLNPGLHQLGTVWLPLPHLLLLPFVQKMEWWQTGIAGAFPSMASYILAAAGLYRLARLWLSARFSVLALAFFALNPGLLYMQTTAMTEPLFLAEMIWSVLLLALFHRALDEDASGSSVSSRVADGSDIGCSADADRHGREYAAPRLLTGAGLVLAAAVLTRYDGWVFTAAAWLLPAATICRRRLWRSPVGGAFIFITALLLACPLGWLAYNARQSGDPLDFMRGPYSAVAIERRTTPPGSFHYPGWHDLRVAGLYFLKVAELGASPVRLADLLLAVALAGTVLALRLWRGTLPLLLIWLPLPFYTYSVAYGAVPIFLPLWFPHSWYNTRYGVELLPAFALFFAFAVAALCRRLGSRAGNAVAWAALAFIVANAAWLLHMRPLVYAEAVENSRTRLPFEEALASALNAVPPADRILINSSDHIGALERAGVPLRQTINDGDYYQWQPALEHPAASAAVVVAIAGDPVARAVAAHPEGLTLVDVVCSTGQPCARIYRSDAHPR